MTPSKTPQDMVADIRVLLNLPPHSDIVEPVRKLQKIKDTTMAALRMLKDSL